MNIHRSGIRLTALTWLVPHETAAVSACSVYTIQPCSMSLHANHIRNVHACLAVTYHLHFWQNDQDLSRATAVTRGWNDTEIRVSTESRPWRRKFSRRSSRDSNPRPFNHESGALTTELSPPLPSLTPPLTAFMCARHCMCVGVSVCVHTLRAGVM